MLYKCLFALASLVSLASALNIPVATAVSNAEALLALSPTQAPAAEELQRRQAGQVTVQTLLAAPDNTCGYFGGSSASPWGCSTGNCVFATPTAGANISGAGNILCCDPKTGCPAQPAPTTCVDRFNYNATCTGSCAEDPATLKCTSGIYLYCNTITFTTPDISAFFCNYISTDGARPADTAFGGQAGHAVTSTVAVFATTPASTTSFSSASAISSSTGAASPERSGNLGPLEKSNKSAIIGGVVGGLLGLALLIGAVVICLKRRNTHAPVQEQKGASSSIDELSAPTPVKNEAVVTSSAR